MIEASYFWQNIFFLAIGTLAIRGSIIALSARVKISDRVKEIFSYIPAAILPAFVTPSVFFHQGKVAWAYDKERFLILIFATVVCYFSRSTLATVGFGLVALYFMTQL
ncbi:MAG: AzlD domain-containing protein [Oligoflexia bacterium]|nr:AzlD domain-containing protein [Oligoflexia bacterium]